jgi:pimeloyl-ACP methyl ester carboxylesterase
VVAVRHHRVEVAGVDTFVREAGPSHAPALVLPHGYPCSSFAYRRLLPALGDRWRLVAPDFPGSGFTADPQDFAYDFDGFAGWLAAFVETLGISRHGLWLHDFGSQIGLRYAIAHPDRIAALVISNGDIYEDTLGPGYEVLKQYWADPSLANLARIQSAVSEEGFRDEVLNDVRPELAEHIPPEMWQLHWSLMTATRRDIAVRVIADLRDNVAWFPRYQAYLREQQPPTLILWGPQDRYMPESSARAYERDLPNAELHLLDAGHWVLETQFEQCVDLLRRFLARTLPS